MELPDNQNDIRLMVAGEMEYLVSSDGFRAAAVDEITSRSQGNFLWASLITKQVVSCHRKDQVQRVLDSTPDGTNQLYDRMMDAVTNLKLDEDKALAEVLLTWSMYAKAPVTVEELSEVCPAELGSIMDLYHTVNHVCGQFVVVNPQGRITLVHPSAREYLERTRRGSLILDSEVGNGKILPRCLAALCDKWTETKAASVRNPHGSSLRIHVLVIALGRQPNRFGWRLRCRCQVLCGRLPRSSTWL
ncbi:hypothetical protein VTK26DRAFT_1464 [Humicola hyalothermophila]